MKTCIEIINADLDWREKELGAFKIFLGSRSIHKGQRNTLLRAAWALLYAHYEGYARFCLSIFYGEVSERLSSCARLPVSTKARSLSSTLRRLRSLPDSDLLLEIENFNQHIDRKPHFPDVDLKSNLWPEILVRFLEEADISSQTVRKHESKLRTLVARRNAIAHGERDMILDIKYFHGFEEAVYDVMYDLTLQIEERLKRSPYS